MLYSDSSRPDAAASRGAAAPHTRPPVAALNAVEAGEIVSENGQKHGSGIRKNSDHPVTSAAGDPSSRLAAFVAGTYDLEGKMNHDHLQPHTALHFGCRS